MQWERVLSEAGYRVTEARRAVSAVLSKAHTPLSPQQILERGQVFHAKLGLVTVYRTLELYEKLGLACRVHTLDGCHGYLAATPGHRHVLVCRQCGRAISFPGRDDLEALIAQLEDRTGYQIQGHLLQLFGLCPDCRRRASAGGGESSESKPAEHIVEGSDG